MTASLDEIRNALKTFLQGHPGIKYVTPDASDFSSMRTTYNCSYTAVPLAIARPQTADDVATLVSYSTKHGIQFTVRSGGNSIFGWSCVQDALMIDLRDIDYVYVDEKKSSATVGGGILQTKLARELSKEGLVTATGSVSFVGLVGWSTYGGYGPLTSKYGLGLDNILGAKVVNAKGEVVVADKELLKGIRGAGGAFGIIVELTVKAYPLGHALTGTVIFDSTDITSAYTNFNAGYQALLDDGSIPSELEVQQLVINTPHGRAFAVGLVWASEDHEAGRASISKIEALGPVMMNTVQPKTIADHIDSAAKELPASTYGLGQTVSIRKLTKEATQILSKAFEKMPSSFGTGFTLHELRGPSAAPNPDSVFASREPHFMLELISMVGNEEDLKESEEWSTSLRKELLQMEPGNLLPGTYISLTPQGDVPLSKIYGPDSNYHDLLDLKQKYDPQHVFSLAVPRLIQH